MEKAAKRFEKERKALEIHDKLLPICQEHVKRGLQHLLSLTFGSKRDILKYVYDHLEANSNLRVPKANKLLTKQFSTTDGTDAIENNYELNHGDGGDNGVMNVSVDGGAVEDEIDFSMIAPPLVPGIELELVDTGREDWNEGNVDDLDNEARGNDSLDINSFPSKWVHGRSKK